MRGKTLRKPLNSDESSLPVEAASLPQSEISPAFLQETLTAPPGAVALQDNASSPQNPPPPLFFASRPMVLAS